MDVVLKNLAKRYQFEWIFRHIDLSLQHGESYAITGPNGSGKSTFLKILSGHLSPSKGSIQFQQGDQALEVEEVYHHLSYAAPYIDLIEEFTLIEAIKFHRQFKQFQNNHTSEELLELLNFHKSKHKQLRFFSSGMKQRLKLLLNICSDTPYLLLDEPSTNLDQQGMEWYLDLMEKYGKNRLVVVASNIKSDYSFCSQELDISKYKTGRKKNKA
ncbi:MAG: ATP-binding cassette domain-containing protein [Saprospiraceae bacterium]